MASTIIELSNDLKTQMQAKADSGDPWLEAVTVERTWNPSKSLTDFKPDTPPLFSVIPAAHVTTRIDNVSFVDWFQIDCGIRCRSDSASRSDALAELVDEVLTWCREEYTPTGDWPLMELGLLPLFDSQSLNTTKLWFSVIRLGLGVKPEDAD